MQVEKRDEESIHIVEIHLTDRELTHLRRSAGRMEMGADSTLKKLLDGIFASTRLSEYK